MTDEEKLESKKESARKWRNKNKDYQSIYKNNNFDKISLYQKEYQLLNKNVLNAKIVIRKKYRYNNDLNYKLKVNVRNIIVKAFKRNGFIKSSKTHEVLGCSFINRNIKKDKLNYEMD